MSSNNTNTKETFKTRPTKACDKVAVGLFIVEEELSSQVEQTDPDSYSNYLGDGVYLDLD